MSKICDKCNTPMDRTKQTVLDIGGGRGCGGRQTRELDLCDHCDPLLRARLMMSIEEFMGKQDTETGVD